MLLSTLKAHQSWVRDLRFVSQSPFYQLISVGDRIAWWDLSQARQNNRSSTKGGLGLPLTPVSPGSVSFDSASHWSARSAGLVQTFEFQGRFASKLFVSPDGQIVLTITDSGILYILRQLVDY